MYVGQDIPRPAFGKGFLQDVLDRLRFGREKPRPDFVRPAAPVTPLLKEERGIPSQIQMLENRIAASVRAYDELLIRVMELEEQAGL